MPFFFQEVGVAIVNQNVSFRFLIIYKITIGYFAPLTPPDPLV